jgi:MATE family multidrug resistance protein
MQELKTQTSYKSIFKMSLPMAIAFFIPQISFFANTFFLGLYQTPSFSNHQSLSVAAISGIFHLVFAMISYGLANGLLMLMSKFAGSENRKMLGHYFSNGLVMGILFSFLLAVFSYFFVPFLFSYAVKDEAILKIATQYAQIRVLGLPILFTAQLSTMFYIAISKSKNLIVPSIIQAAINITLDYVLIFGTSFSLSLGLIGAAWASNISEMVLMLILLIPILTNIKYQDFEFTFLKKFNINTAKEIFFKSSPLMLQYFLSIAAWEIFFLSVEHLGNKELAISQILKSVYGLIGIGIWAFASTTNSIVSNLVGQQNQKAIIPFIIKMIKINFVYCLLMSGFFLVFPHLFFKLYTNDIVLVENGILPLRIVLSSTFILSISSVLFNALIGLGNTLRNLMIEIIAITCYTVYVIYFIEIKKCNLAIAWASEYVYWSIILFIASYFIFGGKWKKDFDKKRKNNKWSKCISS